MIEYLHSFPSLYNYHFLHSSQHLSYIIDPKLHRSIYSILRPRIFKTFHLFEQSTIQCNIPPPTINLSCSSNYFTLIFVHSNSSSYTLVQIFPQTDTISSLNLTVDITLQSASFRSDPSQMKFTMVIRYFFLTNFYFNND